MRPVYPSDRITATLPLEFAIKVSYDGRLILQKGSVMFGISMCGVPGLPNSSHFTLPFLIMNGKENAPDISEVTKDVR